MFRSAHWLALLLVATAAAAVCPPAAADIIVARSGARFEGNVLDDGDAYVVISASGTRMRIAKNVVLEVLPSTPGAPATPSATPPPRPPEPDSTPYMEIPIAGILGGDVMPEAVEACLKYAAQDPALKHIVFRIASPGGAVDAADKIQAVLMRHASRFRYHALVQEALSTASWLAVSCDTIHMMDGSTLGGAVSRTPSDADREEADARMNSVATVRVIAHAASLGHPEAIVRALLQRQAQVVAWENDEKQIEMRSDGASAPSAPSAPILYDTPASVLVLTKDPAVRVGFAKPAWKGAADVGAVLGLKGWRPAYGEYAEGIMRRTKMNREKEFARLGGRDKALDKSRGDRTAMLDFTRQNEAEAKAKDPRAGQYAYDTSGRFTADSRKTWRLQTDTAIAAWRRVQQGAAGMMQLEQEAEALGFERQSHDLNLTDLSQRAGREIERLQRERERKGL